MNFFIKDDAMKVLSVFRHRMPAKNAEALGPRSSTSHGASPARPARCGLPYTSCRSLGWAIVVLVVAFSSDCDAQIISPKGSAKAEIPTEWEVVYLGDTRIGYGYQTREEVRDEKRGFFRTRQHLEMRFKRFGDLQIIKMDSQFEDWSDGTIRSFDLSFGDAPTRRTRIVGTADHRLLRIETTIAKRVTRSSINLTNDVRSPAFENVAISEQMKSPGDTARFKMFKPEMGRTIETVITAQRRTQTKLLDGQWVKVLEVQVTQPQLPEVKIYIDSQGDVVRTDSELFGKRLTTFKVDEKTAMESIAGAEMDQAATSLIPTDKIRRPHETREVTYEITVDGTDPSTLFIESEHQKVAKNADDAVRITVKTPPKSLAERTLRQPSANSGSPDRTFLDSCALIQTDDYYVKDLAQKAAAGRRDPQEVATRCETYVHRHIRTKNFSTSLASAAEVAKSLEGDCTEHAVLLAGMLRANGIPSQVVVGLVYTEPYGSPSFGGHMWTEAWIDNRWVALDATLGRGRIGAAHLAISRSSLGGESPIAASLFLPMFKLLGKTKITVAEVKY